MEFADLIFSFSERLDIAIAAANTEFDQFFTEVTNCSDFITLLLEFLGNFYHKNYIESSDQSHRKAAIYYLYRIALGMLDSRDGKVLILDEPEMELSRKNCQLIYQCNALESIVRVVLEDFMNLEEAVKNAKNDLESLPLLESEQKVRISTSILALMAVQCLENQEFYKDFLDPKQNVEELCLRTFKMSLDMTIIPIKKILFVYCVYLEGLFGGPPKHTVDPVRIVNKEVYSREFRKKQERIKETCPAEEFYVFSHFVKNVEATRDKRKCDTTTFHCVSAKNPLDNVPKCVQKLGRH